VKTSQAGLDLIKQFEGTRLQSYVCPAGILTIGVGHTSAAGPPKVLPNMTITYQEANEILARDLIKYESAVDRLVQVPLTQNQFDALVSFTFNVGEGALAKSTLLKKLNSGNYAAVPGELMKWTKGGGKELPGLVRRRRAEAAMWRGMDDKASIDMDEARLAPDAPQPAKKVTQSKEANMALAVGSLSGVTAATDVVNRLKEAGDNAKSLLDAFMNPNVLVLIIVVMAAVMIWNWRRRRLEQTGE
jgi:lysozyme